MVPADEDELFAQPSAPGRRRKAAMPPVDFAAMVLDHLRTAGVHQTHKADSIHFTSLQPWPGEYIGAKGRFLEGETERRAGILIGPEFGTLSRMDLVAAAREASKSRFDVLIACAFNYDAHASELTKLGPLPILKARMNPDLHMADDLKNTGKGNLFVVFGEPDLIVDRCPIGPTTFASASSAWTYSTRRPATSAPATPRASPPGSSTPTTTRRVSSSATPISSAPTIPTNR